MNCTPSAVSSTATVTRNCRRSTKRTQSTDASDGRPSWQTRRNVKEHDGSHNQRGIAVIPRSRQAPARRKSPARIRSWQEADVALAAEAGSSHGRTIGIRSDRRGQHRPGHPPSGRSRNAAGGTAARDGYRNHTCARRAVRRTAGLAGARFRSANEPGERGRSDCLD